MAVGIDSGPLFDSVIADRVQPLEPGDALVVCTEGVTGAPDPEGREFGREALDEAILATAPQGARVIADMIVERVRWHRRPK